MTPLLSVSEAAHRLSVHPATIRRMIARGEIAAKRVGRVWRIDPTELTAERRPLPGSSTIPARVMTSEVFVERLRLARGGES